MAYGGCAPLSCAHVHTAVSNRTLRKTPALTMRVHHTHDMQQSSKSICSVGHEASLGPEASLGASELGTRLSKQAMARSRELPAGTLDVHASGRHLHVLDASPAEQVAHEHP